MLLATLTLFACGPESYDPPAETQQEAAIRMTLAGLLHTSQYEQFDSQANSLQRKYEAGELNDISLLHIYRAFYDTNPALENKYMR